MGSTTLLFGPEMTASASTLPSPIGPSASMIFFTGSESAMRAYSTASCENQVGSA